MKGRDHSEDLGWD